MSASITGIIDDAVLAIPGMQSGAAAHAAALEACILAGSWEAGIAALHAGVLDIAAARYAATVPPTVRPVTFNDGASDILFDPGHERTVLVHGFSRSIEPKSRDCSYPPATRHDRVTTRAMRCRMRRAGRKAGRTTSRKRRR